jgi:hypothetical protein
MRHIGLRATRDGRSTSSIAGAMRCLTAPQHPLTCKLQPMSSFLYFPTNPTVAATTTTAYTCPCLSTNQAHFVFLTAYYTHITPYSASNTPSRVGEKIPYIIEIKCKLIINYRFLFLCYSLNTTRHFKDLFSQCNQ